MERNEMGEKSRFVLFNCHSMNIFESIIYAKVCSFTVKVRLYTRRERFSDLLGSNTLKTAKEGWFLVRSCCLSAKYSLYHLIYVLNLLLGKSHQVAMLSIMKEKEGKKGRKGGRKRKGPRDGRRKKRKNLFWL